MMRVLHYSAWALLGLALGAPVGYLWESRSMNAAGRLTTQVYALGEFETLASLQYQQADATHGKEALLDLLDFMSQVEATEGNAIGKHIELDRSIVRMRVALLQERSGNKEAAREYIGLALEGLNRSYGRPETETWLRDAVLKQDSRTRYALPTVYVLRQAKK